MYDFLFLICTTEKSKFLSKFLKSVNNLKIKNRRIKLLIIENSIKKKHKSLIGKTLIKHIPFEYSLEKKIGIPFARNKALRLSKKIKARYLCFFDDDCEISKDWMEKIIEFKKKIKSEIVTGPQIPKQKNQYHSILSKSHYNFQKLRWAATNNVVIDKKILDKHNLEFSTKLVNIGGSDQLFFTQLNLKGFEIRWCSNAKVFENQNNLERNFKWFVKRSFRYGISSNLIYKEAYGSFKGSLFVILKFFYELLFFFNYFALVIINPKKNSLFSIMYLFRSIGSFLSLFGIKTKSYI